jgi:tyrosinase
MAPTVEVLINATADPAGRYLTWAPSQCQLRVTTPDGASSPIAVTVRTKPGSTGRLVFRDQPAAQPSPQMAVALDPGGQPSALFVSGEFGVPSVADGDTVLEVLQGTAIVASVPVMVRIRKDAETLTAAERGLFLSALAQLNDSGVYQLIRDCHVADSVNEAHFEDGFWPWHRAFVMDLERELQRIDASVALPYWRFDQPAPKLFTPSFLGAPDPSGGPPRLAPNNPLLLWKTDGQLGINRPPGLDFNGQIVDVVTAAAPLRPEAVIVNFDGTYHQLRPPFEEDPHGAAHMSFRGWMSSIPTAAKDPLFFLLHCNVDRLWAKWQWHEHRFKTPDPDSYLYAGSVTSTPHTRIGHNALDTMWPWNGVTGDPRPPTAPIHPFPAASPAAAPASAPTVGEMIDFQGRADPSRRLGFDYDDVPYEPII